MTEKNLGEQITAKNLEVLNFHIKKIEEKFLPNHLKVIMHSALMVTASLR